MNLLSSRMRAASFAVACAVCISVSSVPLPTEAAAGAPASQVLTQFTTPQGETVSFAQLQDGSIIVEGLGKASAVPSSLPQAATPLDLFHTIAPNQQTPPALVQANAKYLSAKRATASLPIRKGKTALTPPITCLSSSCCVLSPSIHCCAPGLPYTTCYTDATGSASINFSYVSFAQAFVSAITAPAQFSINGVGAWVVPAGWDQWVYEYGFFFNFAASVYSAGRFDFDGGAKYTF